MALIKQKAERQQMAPIGVAETSRLVGYGNGFLGVSKFLEYPICGLGDSFDVAMAYWGLVNSKNIQFEGMWTCWI